MLDIRWLVSDATWLLTITCNIEQTGRLQTTIFSSAVSMAISAIASPSWNWWDVRKRPIPCRILASGKPLSILLHKLTSQWAAKVDKALAASCVQTLTFRVGSSVSAVMSSLPGRESFPWALLHAPKAPSDSIHHHANLTTAVVCLAFCPPAPPECQSLEDTDNV